MTTPEGNGETYITQSSKKPLGFLDSSRMEPSDFALNITNQTLNPEGSDHLPRIDESQDVLADSKWFSTIVVSGKSRFLRRTEWFCIPEMLMCEF